MRRELEAAFDVLFPPTCIECGEDGTWWCEPCLQKIEFFSGTLCPKCGERQLVGMDDSCTGEWPFASLSILSSYAQPGVRLLLTSFKYHRAFCLREAFRAYIARYRAHYRDAWPWAGLSQLTITSVPMDEGRQRERGMDHAWELAQMIQQALIPWADLSPLLTRSKRVQPNAQLGHTDMRKANVRGIFQPIVDAPTNILLIDDVLTTGATLGEATRTLKQAGASNVHVLTFAKG